MCTSYIFEFKWINSHAGQYVKKYGLVYNPEIPWSADQGNEEADELAKQGARQQGVKEQAAGQHLEMEALAEAVMRRLVAAAMQASRVLGQLPNARTAKAGRGGYTGFEVRTCRTNHDPQSGSHTKQGLSLYRLSIEKLGAN